MKKILFIFIIIACIAATVMAQTTDSAIWKTFTSDRGTDFTVEVPENFGSLLTDSTENKPELARVYNANSGSTRFFIISEQTPNNNVSEVILQYIKANLKSPENKADENFYGRVIEFADEEGFYQRVMFVKGAENSYVFHTLGAKKEDAKADKFFDSIKFSKQFSDVKIQSSKKPGNQKVNIGSGSGSGSGQGVGSGSGRGTGQGGGSGVGSGQGNGIGSGAVTSPVPENTPLQIISKPSPRYTDIARIYDISGEVNARVTFLANGEIGSVTPVKSLPFGLTLQAVAAAKQMKFSPPTRNGVPYAVTKTVVFSFQIY